MKCPHCGFENKEGEEICSSCGKEIKVPEEISLPDEEPENEPSYGAIYHLESKDSNGEESEEEEVSLKKASLSKDWKQELKQRVKEIKEKKAKEKKHAVKEEASAEAIEEADYSPPAHEKTEPSSEPMEQDKEEEGLARKKKKKSTPAEKELDIKEELPLFSLDEEEFVPPEGKESPPQEPPSPKEEIKEEKAFPDELQKFVESYEPLDEGVYEEPLKQEVEEKAEIRAEMDVTDREVIIKSRLFAGIFDLLILAIFYLAIIFFTMKIMGTDYITLLKAAPLPLAGLLLLLTFAYFVYFTGFSGQTIGKMALKIRVISVPDGRVTFPRAFMRWVGYLISAAFLLLGFLWITFDSEARGWHDKIAGTRVEIYY